MTHRYIVRADVPQGSGNLVKGFERLEDAQATAARYEAVGLIVTIRDLEEEGT